ncbi:MAG: hypothetical protein RLZZ436_3452 [Planctomycetota bacterium]
MPHPVPTQPALVVPDIHRADRRLMVRHPREIQDSLDLGDISRMSSRYHAARPAGTQSNKAREQPPTEILSAQRCGALLWIGWVILTFASASFAFGVPALNRPVFAVTTLLIVMSAIHLHAIWRMQKLAGPAISLTAVIGLSVAMRFVAVFSTPIQELDYYRYLWDGETVLAGSNPFQVTPEQILLEASQVDKGGPSIADNATRPGNSAIATSAFNSTLVEICKRRPRVHETAARVHYGELPSIYPPVSLAVFASAATMTPASASLETAVVILKAFIVLFDLGVMYWLIRLFKHLGIAPQLVISWAWCPLVIKEFANSGHLDAIAVFFMVGSVTLLVECLFERHCEGAKTHGKTDGRLLSRRGIASSAGLLGFAVGAKLFPVVLMPVMAAVIFHRGGIRQAISWLFVVTTTSAVCCWPMLPESYRNDLQSASREMDTALTSLDVMAGSDESSDPLNAAPAPYQHEQPPSPHTVIHSSESFAMNAVDLSDGGSESSVGTPGEAPRNSLKVFLSSWKMNDLIFMFVEANLTPTQRQLQQRDQWFVFFPQPLRESLTAEAEFRLGMEAEFVPFFITRGCLSLLFFCSAIIWAWRARNQANARDWLASVFSTLAWFWVLSPTLNPWYWTWALPFILFTRHKTWHLLSAIVFVYYLRFWFAYQWGDQPVLGTRYLGEAFFHFVVVWIEHLPWMLLLFVETAFGRLNEQQLQEA